VIQFVPHKVTDDMNQKLCKPFFADEVEKALFMMKPNKSPRPDGFTAGFYQNDIMERYTVQCDEHIMAC
jgi:hypothetical protein